MFRIKICGITRVEDALAAAAAGADAIGLNSYSGSPRCCSLDQAREIARSLDRSICRVGVFVNAPAEEIRRTAGEVGLDLIQLHGDEAPEVLAELRGLPAMRAFRPDGDYSTVAEYLAACHRLRCVPRLALVDASRGGQYGGTGATVDWDGLHQAREQFAGVPLVLAGGLTADNVAEAIRKVRPWGVDTASGVESAPGIKSAERMAAFVAAARAAFADLHKRP